MARLTLLTRLIFLGGFLLTYTTAAQECANPDAGCTTEEDPSCPSRPHIIRCAGKYLDTNQNKKLERSELEAAINSLPWYSRGRFYPSDKYDNLRCDILSSFNALPTFFTSIINHQVSLRLLVRWTK